MAARGVLCVTGACVASEPQERWFECETGFFLSDKTPWESTESDKTTGPDREGPA